MTASCPGRSPGCEVARRYRAPDEDHRQRRQADVAGVSACQLVRPSRVRRAAGSRLTCVARHRSRCEQVQACSWCGLRRQEERVGEPASVGHAQIEGAIPLRRRRLATATEMMRMSGTSTASPAAIHAQAGFPRRGGGDVRAFPEVPVPSKRSLVPLLCPFCGQIHIDGLGPPIRRPRRKTRASRTRRCGLAQDELLALPCLAAAVTMSVPIDAPPADFTNHVVAAAVVAGFASAVRLRLQRGHRRGG